MQLLRRTRSSRHEADNPSTDPYRRIRHGSGDRDPVRRVSLEHRHRHSRRDRDDHSTRVHRLSCLPENIGDLVRLDGQEDHVGVADGFSQVCNSDIPATAPHIRELIVRLDNRHLRIGDTSEDAFHDGSTHRTATDHGHPVHGYLLCHRCEQRLGRIE